MRLLDRVLGKARRLTNAARSEYIAYCRRQPIDSRAVLYESFAGNGALCNPEALFRAALAAPDLTHLHHIWALDAPDRHPEIVAEFAAHPRVRFVERLSREYWMALSTSGFLVNNATFPPDFGKRPGQTYINTWHGTPLKRMGFDMPRGAVESANTIRNFLSADVLLSQSSTMTDLMYRDAYRLGGIYSGRVLEVGYPRVDRQRPDSDQRADALARLAADGIEVGDRTFVLFAPTWRGDSFQSPRDESIALANDVRALQEKLGDGFLVGLKTHQVVHRLAHGVPELAGHLVSNDIPTNLLLAIADVLVTDYSSIFFDYLATGGPIAFYTPAIDDYEGGRGLYVAPSELPGPVVADVDALAVEIADLAAGGGEQWRSRRAAWCEKYTPDDDGGASGRVLDVVFRGLDLPGRIRRLDTERGKQRLLIHMGGMRSNGITTSILNLLGAIDYDRYDVTTIHERPKNVQQWANHARIDPRARRLVRFGGMNGSKIPHVARRLHTTATRVHAHAELPRQRTLWDDEWERCFGDARFDAVIDFSGYSPFWAILLLHSPGALRAIWLHNDLAAEAFRPINGRMRMRRSLQAIASLYPEFDRAVSVSSSLDAINRRSFRAADRDGRFVAARNLMDPTIVERAHDLDAADPGTAEWAARMRGSDEFWFVTVGRYSVEKNQERLIRAFAEVAAQRPHTRLLVVGYGPLRDHLESVIGELGLDERVFLYGPVPDAAPLILAAGAFVLSSDWEGQPMVLLEAAALDRPIVSVAFGSAEDALPPGAMRIVESSASALAAGMIALADGDIASAHLDVAAYNAEALAEFERAISTRAPARD